MCGWSFWKCFGGAPLFFFIFFYSFTHWGTELREVRRMGFGNREWWDAPCASCSYDSAHAS